MKYIAIWFFCGILSLPLFYKLNDTVNKKTMLDVSVLIITGPIALVIVGAFYLKTICIDNCKEVTK